MTNQTQDEDSFPPEFNKDEPPDRQEITSQTDAIRALDGYSGQTILLKPYAQLVAAQFGIELEPDKDLRPVSELNRLRPNQDDLAIPCGKLAMRIVKDLDGFEAEDFNAAGR